MQFLLHKEEGLSERKSVYEERALRVLHSDLSQQLSEMEMHEEKVGG